jgi:phosphopantothenoylcysteine synthetase/decarboxylase
VTSDQPLLLLVVCGAGPAADVGVLVDEAQASGWRVRVIATPAAADFVDTAALEAATGQAVSSQPRKPEPGHARTAGGATAVVVAPATYNTIGKLATGVADTHALVTLAEMIGLGVPVVVVPFVNAALAARAPYRRAVEALREEGVRVLGADDGWVPHPAGTGGDQRLRFPWVTALREAERLAGRAAPPP